MTWCRSVIFRRYLFDPMKFQFVNNPIFCNSHLINRRNSAVATFRGASFDPSGMNTYMQKFSICKRVFHLSSSKVHEIEFEDFMKLRNKGLVVIDVREKNEIKASGSVPGSLNIPSKQISVALSKSPKEFKAKFGKSKPKEGQVMMFLCQRGVRSKAAMDKAVQLGYKKAVSFRGGWEQLSKHLKK